MSEYTTKGRVGLDELEAVGRRLIVDGYLRGGSVLTPGRPVWAHGNFQELKAIYVDSPGEGYRDFGTSWQISSTVPATERSSSLPRSS